MHCRTASGRGAVHCGGEHRLASVYLLTASLFLHSQALLPSLPRFPRSFFPFASFTLCACGLRTCARFSLSLSLPYPLCVVHRPTLLSFFLLSFLPLPFFSLREDPRLVPHRPAERKDCKPTDEPRIPEWGLLHSPFPLLYGCRARARASDGWMEYARRAEREHRQLVGGGGGICLLFPSERILIS